MGYRHRFASVNKKIVDEKRDLSYDEFVDYLLKENKDAIETGDNFTYFSTSKILNQKEIFDFGKDFECANGVICLSKPLFSDEKLQEETEMYLCDEKCFLFVIEEYRKKILEIFKSLDAASPSEIKLAIQSKIEKWENLATTVSLNDLPNDVIKKLNESHYPYNIDKTKEKIVNSWLFEYEIFELVRIYKTFDWKNNYLLFYGW